MRKFLLLILPFIVFSSLDMGLTIWGQPERWWSGEYAEPNEFNPVNNAVLCLGPSFALGFAYFYVFIICFVIAQFKHQYAVLICTACSVGHMIGAHSWAINYFDSYNVTRFFVMAAGILAACTTEYLILEIRREHANPCLHESNKP